MIYTLISDLCSNFQSLHFENDVVLTCHELSRIGGGDKSTARSQSNGTKVIMAPKLCSLCHVNRALVKRPKTGQQVCKDCFFEVFETEVHNTITEGNGIFHRGEKVAIGASGGKGTCTACFSSLAAKTKLTW